MTGNEKLIEEQKHAEYGRLAGADPGCRLHHELAALRRAHELGQLPFHDPGDRFGGELHLGHSACGGPKLRIAQ
jgi:hypothetical protein